MALQALTDSSNSGEAPSFVVDRQEATKREQQTTPQDSKVSFPSTSAVSDQPPKYTPTLYTTPTSTSSPVDEFHSSDNSNDKSRLLSSQWHTRKTFNVHRTPNFDVKNAQLRLSHTTSFAELISQLKDVRGRRGDSYFCCTKQELHACTSSNPKYQLRVERGTTESSIGSFSEKSKIAGQSNSTYGTRAIFSILIDSVGRERTIEALKALGGSKGSVLAEQLQRTYSKVLGDTPQYFPALYCTFTMDLSLSISDILSINNYLEQQSISTSARANHEGAGRYLKLGYQTTPGQLVRLIDGANEALVFRCNENHFKSYHRNKTKQGELLLLNDPLTTTSCHKRSDTPSEGELITYKAFGATIVLSLFSQHYGVGNTLDELVAIAPRFEKIKAQIEQMDRTPQGQFKACIPIGFELSVAETRELQAKLAEKYPPVYTS
ncbi:MAG: hypothetical protein ACPGUD_06580 [Parashewanella sp.]